MYPSYQDEKFLAEIVSLAKRYKREISPRVLEEASLLLSRTLPVGGYDEIQDQYPDHFVRYIAVEEHLGALNDMMRPADSKRLRTMPYERFLMTSYWKGIARTLKDLAGACQRCHAVDTDLHTHHVNYGHRGQEFLGDNLMDLEVLCDCCHRQSHGIEELPS